MQSAGVSLVPLPKQPSVPEARLLDFTLISFPVCGSQLSIQAPVWLLWGNAWPSNKCNPSPPGLCVGRGPSHAQEEWSLKFLSHQAELNSYGMLLSKNLVLPPQQEGAAGT